MFGVSSHGSGLHRPGRRKARREERRENGKRTNVSYRVVYENIFTAISFIQRASYASHTQETRKQEKKKEKPTTQPTDNIHPSLCKNTKSTMQKHSPTPPKHKPPPQTPFPDGSYKADRTSP